jgi:glycosyltransferase involved in cell wall biosynthesis
MGRHFMSAAPPLTVLLPVRDGAAFLEEALASLERQSYTDFQVMAVDDGSGDGTGDILREVARRDGRFRVLTQEPKGIVAALELARSKAHSPYLARMDADDVALPERFQRQMDLVATDRRIVACGTWVTYFPRERVRDGARRYQEWINGLTTHEAMERDLFVECPLPHPTLILRADAVEVAGGYRELGWAEDYDLVLRLWEGGGRLAKVPETLLRWREGEGRLSRTHGAYSEGSFRRCKVHFLLRSHLCWGRGLVVWGAGPVGKAFARELLRQGGTLRAFVDLDPKKVGQTVHGVSVIPPEDVERFRGSFCVAAVGQEGARHEIRAALERAGWEELRDFVAVA